MGILLIFYLQSSENLRLPSHVLNEGAGAGTFHQGHGSNRPKGARQGGGRGCMSRIFSGNKVTKATRTHLTEAYLRTQWSLEFQIRMNNNRILMEE